MLADPNLGGGSSPRLRGTAVARLIRAGHRRFIPAPAGNGRAASVRRVGVAVHPRACGERERLRNAQEAIGGSSPRLRGTVHPAGWRIAPRRFIPAPAGNGCRTASARCPTPVHPRACGERAGIRHLTFAVVGSSPRLRGTVRSVVGDRVDNRFIPAPAGNGIGELACGPLCPVHPRACGERSVVVRLAKLPAGSSPRLRGTAAARCRPDRSGRFIPAPAGNGCGSVSA